MRCGHISEEKPQQCCHRDEPRLPRKAHPLDSTCPSCAHSHHLCKNLHPWSSPSPGGSSSSPWLGTPWPTCPVRARSAMLIISGFFFLLALITKDETWVGLTAACLVMPDGPSGMGPGLTRCSGALHLVTGSEMETYFRLSC